MTTKKLALAACAAVAVIASGTVASAQTAQEPAITYGAPVAGVCALSIDGVLAGSTVGKYVDGRLQQIGQQIQAELTGEKTGIENEAKTLQGQRSTLDQNTFEQRVAALQVRQNALERKAALRDREMQATQQQAVGRVVNEMRPLIATAAQSQKCAIVIDRSAVVMVNPQMDLTSAVVTALNGKLTQFAFERTRLDTPQASTPPVTQTPGARK
jgi:outer membrane protein